MATFLPTPLSYASMQPHSPIQLLLGVKNRVRSRYRLLLFKGFFSASQVHLRQVHQAVWYGAASPAGSRHRPRRELVAHDSRKTDR